MKTPEFMPSDGMFGVLMVFVVVCGALAGRYGLPICFAAIMWGLWILIRFTEEQ